MQGIRQRLVHFGGQQELLGVDAAGQGFIAMDVTAWRDETKRLYSEIGSTARDRPHIARMAGPDADDDELHGGGQSGLLIDPSTGTIKRPDAHVEGAMDHQDLGKNAVKTGTTTLAIAASDGVVMATEKRATMGHLIGHKNTQKLFNVDDHLALTTAGLVGDAQMIARNLAAQAQLYRYKRDAAMPVRGAATLLGNMLNQSKFQPYWVQLIVGGYDARGGGVYSIDSAGGAIPEAWTVTGSGSPFVYGVLEDRMEDEMDVKKATDLAIRGLNAAMRRDSASGNGMDVAVIDPDGFRRLAEADIDKRHKALKLPMSYHA